MKQYVTPLLATSALIGAFAASAVSAATCHTRDVVFEITQAADAYCDIEHAVRDVPTLGPIFGVDDWTLADSNLGGLGDGTILFDLDPLNGTMGGSLSVLNPRKMDYMVALQGNEKFGLFQISGNDSDLTWSISSEDLRNATLWYSPLAAVPLPAGGALLLGALGGLWALRRRKVA